MAVPFSDPLAAKVAFLENEIARLRADLDRGTRSLTDQIKTLSLVTASLKAQVASLDRAYWALRATATRSL